MKAGEKGLLLENNHYQSVIREWLIYVGERQSWVRGGVVSGVGNEESSIVVRDYSVILCNC